MQYPNRAYLILPKFPKYYLDRSLRIWKLFYEYDYKLNIKYFQKELVKPINSYQYCLYDNNGKSNIIDKNKIYAMAVKKI